MTKLQLAATIASFHGLGIIDDLLDRLLLLQLGKVGLEALLHLLQDAEILPDCRAYFALADCLSLHGLGIIDDLLDHALLAGALPEASPRRNPVCAEVVSDGVVGLSVDHV